MHFCIRVAKEAVSDNGGIKGYYHLMSFTRQKMQKIVFILRLNFLYSRGRSLAEREGGKFLLRPGRFPLQLL